MIVFYTIIIIICVIFVMEEVGGFYWVKRVLKSQYCYRAIFIYLIYIACRSALDKCRNNRNPKVETLSRHTWETRSPCCWSSVLVLIPVCITWNRMEMATSVEIRSRLWTRHQDPSVTYLTVKTRLDVRKRWWFVRWMENCYIMLVFYTQSKSNTSKFYWC